MKNLHRLIEACYKEPVGLDLWTRAATSGKTLEIRRVTTDSFLEQLQAKGVGAPLLRFLLAWSKMLQRPGMAATPAKSQNLQEYC